MSERELTVIKGETPGILQVALGNSGQGILVPGFIAVNTGSGQVKEPQEKGRGQLLLGLVISNQEEHVQIVTHLLVEPAGHGLSCHLPDLFIHPPLRSNP